MNVWLVVREAFRYNDLNSSEVWCFANEVDAGAFAADVRVRDAVAVARQTLPLKWTYRTEITKLDVLDGAPPLSMPGVQW